MKEGWALKIAEQFAISGPVAYKAIAYEKTNCKSIIFSLYIRQRKFFKENNDIQKYCLNFECYVTKSSEAFIVYLIKDEKPLEKMMN